MLVCCFTLSSDLSIIYIYVHTLCTPGLCIMCTSKHAGFLYIPTEARHNYATRDIHVLIVDTARRICGFNVYILEGHNVKKKINGNKPENKVTEGITGPCWSSCACVGPDASCVELSIE